MNLSDPSLVAGIALFLIWVAATRLLLLWTVRRLRADERPRPTVLAIMNGYFYSIPLLIGPVLGVAEWSALIAGVYLVVATLLTVSLRLMFSVLLST